MEIGTTLTTFPGKTNRKLISDLAANNYQRTPAANEKTRKQPFLFFHTFNSRRYFISIFI